MLVFKGPRALQMIATLPWNSSTGTRSPPLRCGLPGGAGGGGLSAACLVEERLSLERHGEAPSRHAEGTVGRRRGLRRGRPRIGTRRLRPSPIHGVGSLLRCGLRQCRRRRGPRSWKRRRGPPRARRRARRREGSKGRKRGGGTVRREIARRDLLRPRSPPAVGAGIVLLGGDQRRAAMGEGIPTIRRQRAALMAMRRVPRRGGRDRRRHLSCRRSRRPMLISGKMKRGLPSANEGGVPDSSELNPIDAIHSPHHTHPPTRPGSERW